MNGLKWHCKESHAIWIGMRCDTCLNCMRFPTPLLCEPRPKSLWQARVHTESSAGNSCSNPILQCRLSLLILYGLKSHPKRYRFRVLQHFHSYSWKYSVLAQPYFMWLKNIPLLLPFHRTAVPFSWNLLLSFYNQVLITALYYEMMSLGGGRHCRRDTENDQIRLTDSHRLVIPWGPSPITRLPIPSKFKTTLW